MAELQNVTNTAVAEKPVLKHTGSRVAKDVNLNNQFVTVEQFDNKFSEMMAILTGLAGKFDEKFVEAKPVDTASPIGSEENPGVPMNPQWRKTVDDILGPDFGIQVDFTEDGNQIRFTVIVPLEKSNARRDYLDYYKNDYRTIALNPTQTGVGVKQWCERIKRNLGRSLSGETK